MSIFRNLTLSIAALSLWFTVETLSSFSVVAKPKSRSKSKSSQKKRGVREKNIIREKSYRVKKGQRKTKVDFDDVGISGKRNDPLGSFIKRQGADKNFDLIKIRLRWHPEMVQSAASLETGRSR